MKAISSLKDVRDHYANVALKVQDESNNSADNSTEIISQIGEDVAGAIHGLERMADLPKRAVSSCRGCADSVGKAKLKPGEVVLDLGSGGGGDVIVAAQTVGHNGYVYGLDMTDEMLELANANIAEAQITNAEFIKGHIEEIPLPDAHVDVVLSNCVLNFSADKTSVLKESFRVLKPGGRIIISDIVSFLPIAPEIYDDLCAFVGCINGMSSDAEYRSLFKHIGFERIEFSQISLYSYESMEQKSVVRGREAQFAPLKNYAQAIDKVSGSVTIEARKPLTSQG